MTNYKTIDLIKTRIPDCLVKYNKTGSGSGEARLYVGGHNIRNWDEFFGDYKLKCFFYKKNLQDYLDSVEFEYKNPSQGYKNDITGYWESYKTEVEGYPDIIYFSIFRNNDNDDKDITSRYYIKSNDKIYDFFRRIALPNISSMLIQKIKDNDEEKLWFRLYLNEIGYEFEQQIADENIEQIQSDETLNATEKERIIKARVGQGYYRKLIIDKYSKCIITGIDDERILIASHIKPWISSNNSERISRENGLLLSPTFDKLFDKGLISFKDTGLILLSNHFSDGNFSRVHLLKGRKYDLKITNEMKSFLEFHRDVIYMG